VLSDPNAERTRELRKKTVRARKVVREQKEADVVRSNGVRIAVLQKTNGIQDDLARAVVVAAVDVLVDSSPADCILYPLPQSNKTAPPWSTPSPNGLQDSVLLVLHRVSIITHFIKYP